MYAPIEKTPVEDGTVSDNGHDDEHDHDVDHDHELKEDNDLEMDHEEHIKYGAVPGFKYKQAMKLCLPVRFKPMSGPSSPLDDCGFFSFTLLTWMTPLFVKAYKTPLKIDDLGTISDYDRAEYNHDRFEKYWQDEVAKKGAKDASLGKAAFRFLLTRQLISIATLVIATLAAFCSSAILVNRLLIYIEDDDDQRLWYGLVLALCIFVLNVIRVGGDAFFWTYSCRTASRFRSGILSLTFRAVANLRSLQGHNVGKIVNICGNDGQRLFEMCVMGNYVISSVIILVASLIAAQLIVGLGALIGSAVTYCIVFPLLMKAMAITFKLRMKCVKIVDRRIQKMNEILTSIKFIKMYAWETAFGKAVQAIRTRERSLLEKSAIIQSFFASVMPGIPTLAAVLSIIIHVLLGNSLSASEAFTLVSLLNVMRSILGPTPYAFRVLAETSVSFQRLKDIITLEQVEPNEPLDEASENMVDIHGGTFGWHIAKADDPKARQDKKGKQNKTHGKSISKISEGNSTTADANGPMNSEPSQTLLSDAEGDDGKLHTALSDINIVIKKGNLMGVCGAVGSGKSSLITAILGLMEKTKGTCRVKGSFAYVAQEAWIFNATVQENILFGQKMDQDRYDAVLTACSLEQDLDVLVDGDQTEIGERGINLSGGQKQRVSLARAVYADHDVYLLDDPLSAVDAQVGDHIFNGCIKGLLRDKTVLFVTHQLQYLKDCDAICVLVDGRVVEQGSHGDIMGNDGEYARLIQAHLISGEGMPTDDAIETSSGKVISQIHLRSGNQSVPNKAVTAEVTAKPALKLTSEEKLGSGKLQWKTCQGYIRAMGGYCSALVVLFSFVIIAGLYAGNVWWLGYWIETSSSRHFNETGNGTEANVVNDPRLGFYMGIYGGSIFLIIMFSLIKGVLFAKLTLRASSSLHSSLFQKVIRSPMSFFDTTPTGRILNRFSKDMDELDVLFPINLEFTLDTVFSILASIVTISIIFPYFLVAVAVVFAIFVVIMRYYHNGIRDMKQLENVSRSPWFSHIGSTVGGLATIHAYGKTDQVVMKYMELIDTNAHAMMLFRMANRWAGARLELLVVFMIAITALMAVLTKGQLPPSFVGLAISFAIQLGGKFKFFIGIVGDTEARFLSAERVLEYINSLKAEGSEVSTEPEKDWPVEGHIQFQDLRLRYREDLPRVLKDVTITVRAGEKIGIAGRTGSGKSSLGVALFRLVEAEGGTIVIDGVNIGTIGLTDLRSRISVIPQDPVLFIGTIRYNLDPFHEYCDDALWRALQSVRMKERISAIDHQLEAPVTEGGDNFSVGERQLLCMARALLRNSKILFLDEATAAIDTETDSLIQETIRSAFSDCTTLTIAHRLNTVLDSDRILVMDDGKVAEFDTPAVLRSNPNSLFSGLLAAAETREEDAPHDGQSAGSEHRPTNGGNADVVGR